MSGVSEDQIRYAGTYDLLEANLRSMVTGQSRSIMGFFETFAIDESMYKTYISGTIKLVDAVNLHRSLPITGKEILTIKTKDYYGNERSEAFFVYAMSNYKMIGNADSNAYEYILHFCSREKFIMDLFDIKRAFNGYVHEQVQTIFRDYVQNYDNEESGLSIPNIPFKSIKLQPTDNISSYCIPNYKADEAIRFLARRAHSSTDPSQTFLFWETRKRYNFGTPYYTYTMHVQENASPNDETRAGADTADPGAVDTARLADVPSFYYNPKSSNTSDDQNYLMKELLAIDLDVNFNTIAAHKGSGYISNATEIDILNRTPITTVYNHAEQLQANSTPFGDVYLRHELNFINKYFTQAYNPLVIKDYISPAMVSQQESFDGTIVPSRDPQHYGELMTKNATIDYNMRESAISITVRGYNKLEAGRLIYLNIPDTVRPEEKDKWYSGIYVILSATHVYEGSTYYCKLSISRGGISNSPLAYVRAAAEAAEAAAAEAAAQAGQDPNQTGPQ